MRIKKTKQKDNLLNERTYCPIIHLRRGQYPKFIKNSHNSTPKNQPTNLPTNKQTNKQSSLGWVAQLVGALSHRLEVCRINSWSRNIPRLWVQSPVRAWTGGNQAMSLSFSAPPSSLSEINKHILK